MKNIFLITLSVVLLTSCTATQYAYTDFNEPIIRTYEVNGNKDELFLKSNLWMISVFKDAKSVIQYSDKNEGILAGKYLLHYYVNPYSHNDDSKYAVIEIRIKDNKAHISVTPDNWKYSTFDIYNRPVKGTEWNYNKEMALADIEALCESFNAGLTAQRADF